MKYNHRLRSFNLVHICKYVYGFTLRAQQPNFTNLHFRLFNLLTLKNQYSKFLNSILKNWFVFVFLHGSRQFEVFFILLDKHPITNPQMGNIFGENEILKS